MAKIKIPSNIKTVLWNFLYQAIAFTCRYFAENITGFNIPPETAACLGILLSAVSKYYATKKK